MIVRPTWFVVATRAWVPPVILLAACSAPPAEPPPAPAPKLIEGMWSDPPNTTVGDFCRAWCTDAGIERLNALLDDPANDARPFPQLRGIAADYQRDRHIRSLMTGAALESFPLDPADDPGLLQCEPWGLARQIFAPHQIEIRQRGSDTVELHYGEWDARRTVYMIGRPRPDRQGPTRLGYSVGRWDGEALVVETTAVSANQTMWWARHSDQLRVVERFARGDDGKTLWLTATLEDPWSLREPVVVKKVWRWAPESEIAPYEDCQPATGVRKGVRQP